MRIEGNSLDAHGNDGLAKLLALRHYRRQLVLRPVGAASNEAAAVDEGDDGQGPGGLAGRGHGDVEGQAFGGAELVVWVREGVLEEQMLVVAVFRVCYGERSVQMC